MTKLPNHKSKTLRLVLVPKQDQETKIRAFKEIVARNGLCVSSILYEKVEAFLREHNYPTGNSQTLITVFSGKPKVTANCDHRGCGEPATFEVWGHNKWHGYLCGLHKQRNEDARLLKRCRRL